MGFEPKPEDVLQDTSIKPDGGHSLPIDNFLNAQCR